MKILHVWNTAAVPSILSKFLRRKGVASDVIMRGAFDRYGFKKFYANCTTNYDVSVMDFFLIALKKASDYDIIHIHSVDKLVPLIKFCHKKPVLLHYHGTDIRGRGRNFIKKVYRSFSNGMLVSTPDLLTDLPKAIHIPNPVDIDLFQRTHRRVDAKGRALFFLKYPDNRVIIDTVKKYAEKKGLKLEIYDRRYQGESILYEKLPQLYNRYEYFIDRIILKDLSKMALEALACGVKVIKDEHILTDLPKSHDPYNVTEKLIVYYKHLLCAHTN
jgi:glycosyltransferase involved in cell wall biosynthesis